MNLNSSGKDYNMEVIDEHQTLQQMTSRCPAQLYSQHWGSQQGRSKMLDDHNKKIIAKELFGEVPLDST